MSAFIHFLKKKILLTDFHNIFNIHFFMYFSLWLWWWDDPSLLCYNKKGMVEKLMMMALKYINICYVDWIKGYYGVVLTG